MTAESTQECPQFLSALPARRGERQVALVVVLSSIIFFLAAAPFAKDPLVPVWTFLPIYQSALVINDVITAALLFGQFRILRSRALLVLASGYLFNAVMAVLHLLSFPDLFTPFGLPGTGAQTTAWLYFFWHGGFPLFVVIYAMLKEETKVAEGQTSAGGSTGFAILSAIALVCVLAGSLSLLTTSVHDVLPAIMAGNRDAPAKVVVATASWTLSLVALAALWRKRPQSVLDLWLMVVMCAWVFDIALASVLNAGRFDVGWYLGRIYGLLATSFVLLVLLYENSMLYAALIETHASDQRKTAELELLTTVDALTGIANRRCFDKAIDVEWRRTVRHGTPLSLLMIDVDCFKGYNDTYGHVAGDACLRAIAELLASSARRAGEIAARYGGEEFAVLLPHVDETAALSLAGKVCQCVRDLQIQHQASVAAAHVTVSIGVASASSTRLIGATDAQFGSDGEWDEVTRLGPVHLVQAADQALYAAKAAGRNRVSLAERNDLPLSAQKRPAA
jgi:diguanylate cyclase (GGDEF)-like protein